MLHTVLRAIDPHLTGSCALKAASVIAISVELLRLYHRPQLDAFRATPAGRLLLGRIFSLWNIVA